MKVITMIADITYSGLRRITPLICEYKHTGTIYETGKSRYTSSAEIAQRWKDEGKKVREKQGYYYIDRMAIPSINASGKPDKWYINNSGDMYEVHRVSKYGRRIHKELSAMQAGEPLFNLQNTGK